MQRQLALTSLARPDAAGAQPAVVGEPPDRAAAGRAARLDAGGRPVSRVLVVTNDFPTRRGGIESFVLALCEGMPADEVVVYTASMPGDARLRRGAAVPGLPRPEHDAAADAGRSRGGWPR